MEITAQARELILGDARMASKRRWEHRFHGWRKLNVYDQIDTRRRIIVDPNFCVGCAVANCYQGVTGALGEYAIKLYEGAKRKHADHADEKGGINVPDVADEATEQFGGGWIWLDDFEDILDWLVIKSPIVAGFPWTMGMHHPVGRGGFFRRLFGPRWMDPQGTAMYYHSVAIMATSPKDDGFVVVENSYGLHWGVKGTARISWDDLKALIESEKAAFWGFDWYWKGGDK